VRSPRARKPHCRRLGDEQYCVLIRLHMGISAVMIAWRVLLR
jgi:hypothetical protein